MGQGWAWRDVVGRLGAGSAVLAGDLLLVGPIPLILSSQAPAGVAPFAVVTILLGGFVIVGRNASLRVTHRLGFAPGEGNAGQLVEGVRAITSGVYCGLTWLDPTIWRCSLWAVGCGVVATLIVAPLLASVGTEPADGRTATA